MAVRRWWWVALFVVVGGSAGVGVGCKDSGLLGSAHERQARELTAALEDAAFEKSVTEAIAARKELAVAGFPVQRVTGQCSDSVVEVKYDPYRDEIRFTIYQPGALDEQLRWLELNGRRVFEETKPFLKPTQLQDQNEQSRPRFTIARASSKQAELFPPGKDVELKLTAECMVARKTSETKFRYQPFVHKGWTVRLHVFTKHMAAAIKTHADDIRYAAGAVYVLENLLGETASQLRGAEHPAAKQAVARYDELLAWAKKGQREKAEPPYADKKEALVLVHEPPCD